MRKRSRERTSPALITPRPARDTFPFFLYFLFFFFFWERIQTRVWFTAANRNQGRVAERGDAGAIRAVQRGLALIVG